MKKLYPLIIASLFAAGLPAQNITSSPSSSLDRLHLHLDKDNYLPGEIVWFKAYLQADNDAVASGLTLFTELWDSKGNRVDSFVSPVRNGTSFGQFVLPEFPEIKELVVRSFTRSMAAEHRTFMKKIWVAPENYSSAATGAGNISLALFPEGGNLINNVSNRIAFKAAFSNGRPWQLNGAIKNDKGEFVDSIHSVHDGMGSFLFTPGPGERYYIEWDDEQTQKRRTELPLIKDRGVSLQVLQHNGHIRFALWNSSPSAELSELYIAVNSQGQQVYEAIINPSKEKMSGSIPTATIADGIAWLSVFDKNRSLLAQRAIFIDHRDLYFTTNIHPLEMNVDSSGLKWLELEIEDTVAASLSVSVIDITKRDQSVTNIFSDLLLNRKTDISNPAQYFTKEKNEERLDLVMLTGDWPIANKFKTIKPRQEEKFLGYAGMITDENSKPLSETPVAVIIQARDAASEVFTDISDKNGFFRRDDLLFGDSATIFYTVTKAKTGKAIIDIRPTYDLSIPVLPFKFPALPSKEFQWNGKGLSIEEQQTYKTRVFVDSFERPGKMLKEVIVTAKFDSLRQMDEKYASPMLQGLFGGRAYDYMDDPIASRAPAAVCHILKWMLPSRIEKGCLAWYLDERLIPSQAARQMISVRSEDIAYVKYAPYDPQSLCSGLYIYTKKDEDYEKQNEKRLGGRLNKVKIAGYTPMIEFGLPEEITSANDTIDQLIPDNSSTILWEPNLIIDEDKKARISFKTKNKSAKYLVVVEGTNERGQYTYAELILE